MRNNGTGSTTEPQRIKRNRSEAGRRTEKKTAVKAQEGRRDTKRETRTERGNDHGTGLG